MCPSDNIFKTLFTIEFLNRTLVVPNYLIPLFPVAEIRQHVSHQAIQTRNEIKITVTGLFNLDQDIPGFKDHLRDFLVQIREFTGEDDSDLFLEEREDTLKAAQDEKRKVQMSVPGILNPHEMEDDGMKD